MSKCKKQTPTPQEVFNNTNACITCVHEDLCTKLNKILPFPLNLCEHCEKFEKVTKIFE